MTDNVIKFRSRKEKIVDEMAEEVSAEVTRRVGETYDGQVKIVRYAIDGILETIGRVRTEAVLEGVCSWLKAAGETEEDLAALFEVVWSRLYRSEHGPL